MATFTVSTTNDAGAGSLRQAIIDANGTPGSTVDFNLPNNSTITLISQIQITSNMTIINNNPSTIIVSGGGTTRIFLISAPSPVVSITNLTLRDGFTNADGAAINNSGILTINNCVITNNNANGGFGAGIYNTLPGNVTLNYCTISDNQSTANGAGLHNDNGSIMAVNNSTISGNIITTLLFVLGAGIYNGISSSLTVLNSTFNGNVGFNGSGLYNTGTLTMTNSTVSGNGHTDTSIGIGGGVSNVGTATLNNTIVALNFAESDPDISGNFSLSSGYNLIGDVGGSTGITDGVNGNIVGVNPLLNPLANYGGPTLTMSLQFGSPAIDVGNNALVPPGTLFDQRGPGFPRIINGTVDIGAIEAALACYSGKSLILTRNKLTGEIAEIQAKNVYADTHEVFDTVNQIFIPIKLNIVAGLTTRYVKIKKNSLGENMPNADFYVTSGHKIIINGFEIKAKYIPNTKRIKVKPENIYSICTENRTSIKVNGLNVIAWGYDEWMEKSSKRGLGWKNNKQEQYDNKY